MLIETVEENKRCKNFIRIYPAQGSNIYEKYFESSKNSNRLLYQCLYGKYIFNEGGDPRSVLMPKTVVNESKKWAVEPCLKVEDNTKNDNDSVISPDYCLIEYLRRLEELTKTTYITEIWKLKVINFLNSYIWKRPLDLAKGYICNKSRLDELIKIRISEFRTSELSIARKSRENKCLEIERALSRFSNQELENIIINSNKSYSIEFQKCFKGDLLGQMQSLTQYKSKKHISVNEKHRKKDMEEIIKKKKDDNESNLMQGITFYNLQANNIMSMIINKPIKRLGTAYKKIQRPKYGF